MSAAEIRARWQQANENHRARSAAATRARLAALPPAPPVAAVAGVPVSGALSVTPLYTAPGDVVVWWDGASWQELSVSGGSLGYTCLEASGPNAGLSDGGIVSLVSLALPAGDWIVNGSVYFNTGTALIYKLLAGADLSLALPPIPYYAQISPSGVVAGGEWCMPIPERRFGLGSAATVYLMIRADFGAGSTMTATGHLIGQMWQAGAVTPPAGAVWDGGSTWDDGTTTWDS